ncbi:PGN_0703 family putative restriction endonuclease [Ilumatobacter sp.]|uniref:PGN_0703 family putative restriction endonuclease n=1 Tax=Ilumatobacter sp. TaxID=1967498 RepID=UPI003AF44CC4
MVVALTEEILEAADCLLDHDVVRGNPTMTEFRRCVRYHHAMWRQARGYPIGTHRVRPGTPPRAIGSQLDLEFALASGATFVTTKALDAARARASVVEAHQKLNRRSFWADLLSSEALAVNLFGDLAADIERADRAVHTWWPTTPGKVTEVHFVHSPGRFDPSYSNSLRSFDAMFVLELPDGTNGALAIDVKYREVTERRGVKPTHMPRFSDIHDRSGVFAPGALDVLNPSRVSMIWLEHLLLLSMLQHDSGRWTWGRYVIVHPDANTDIAHAADEYRTLLNDDATFHTSTIDDLLAVKALTVRTTAALRGRYLPRTPKRSGTQAHSDRALR